MRPLRLLLVLALPWAVVACRESDSATPTTTTTAPPTTTVASATTTTAVPDTTIVDTVPPTSAPDTTTTPTAPDTTVPTSVVDGPSTGAAFDVVLLDAADQLNVRNQPDPSADVLTRLDRGTVVTATGRAADFEGSLWFEITAGATTGWVNTFYLAPQWAAADFRADPRVTALVDQLLVIMRDRGDLQPVTGRRGLIVSHFDPPRRFKPAELPGLLTSATEYGWGSSACSPEECGTQTFEAVFGAPFVQAYDDVDRQIVFNEIIGGGNMMLQPIPEKFQGVNYLAIYDPGDNPDFAGLDWSTWYVYFVLHDDEPVIVGLSTDEWAP
jgi:hypothetical protein